MRHYHTLFRVVFSILYLKYKSNKINVLSSSNFIHGPAPACMSVVKNHDSTKHLIY